MNKFWNKEYKLNHHRDRTGRHLALSNNPSEDLIKFTKWLERNTEVFPLTAQTHVLDLGCGNGRNLIYLSKNYGIRGTGYDISSEAIDQAKELSKNLKIEYQTRSIVGDFPLGDESQNLVLDMMTSHFLSEKERKSLIKEIVRILKPNGWFYFKTFLLDEDIHAERLLREHPGKEVGTYIHPKIGAAEHVSTETEIKELFKENFIIHKMLRSHKHIEDGHAAKRRSISVYAEKI